jgi:hypothetical protein
MTTNTEKVTDDTGAGNGAAKDRWLIEQSLNGGVAWSPVTIVRIDDDGEDEVLLMEPEDWQTAVQRYVDMGFLFDDPDTFRLRNVRTGEIIHEDDIPAPASAVTTESGSGG